mgnify:CR=1 FL=1
MPPPPPLAASPASSTGAAAGMAPGAASLYSAHLAPAATASAAEGEGLNGAGGGAVVEARGQQHGELTAAGQEGAQQGQQDQQWARRGRKVVVLGDTCDSRAIAAPARNCDVVSHEATFMRGKGSFLATGLACGLS